MSNINPLRSIGALRQHDEDEAEFERFYQQNRSGLPGRDENYERDALRKEFRDAKAKEKSTIHAPVDSYAETVPEPEQPSIFDKLNAQRDAFEKRISANPDMPTGEKLASVGREALDELMTASSWPFAKGVGAIKSVSPTVGHGVEKFFNIPFEISHSAAEKAKETFPEQFDASTSEGRRNLDLLAAAETAAGLGMTHTTMKGVGAVVGAGLSAGGRGMPTRLPSPLSAGALAPDVIAPGAFGRLPPKLTPHPVEIAPAEPFPAAPEIDRTFPAEPSFDNATVYEVTRTESNPDRLTVVGEYKGPPAGTGMVFTAPWAQKIAGKIANTKAGAAFGSAVESGIGKVADATKETKDYFTANPGLENIDMPIDPAYPESRTKANKALSLAKAKMGSAGDTWGERSREIDHVLGKLNDPEMETAFKEYLHYQDLAERGKLNELRGEPVLLEGGISIADAIRLSREAKNRVLGLPPGHFGNAIPAGTDPARVLKGQDFLAEVMPKVETMRTDISDLAIKTGQMDPSQVREKYVPHIIDDRLQQEFTPGVLNDIDSLAFAKRLIAEGDTSLGARSGGASTGNPIKTMTEKTATGSTRGLVKTEGVADPIGALGVKGAAVARRGYMNKFIADISETPGVNFTEDVRTGKIPFDAEKMAVYDVGGKGQIFSKEIATALGKAQEMGKLDLFTKAWKSVNNVMRTGVLKLSPGFQIRQIFDDLAAGVTNAPWGSKVEFMKGAVKHAGIILREFGKINKGEFSPIIAKYRDSGLMTETIETLIDTVDGIKKISDKTRRGSTSGPWNWLMDRVNEIGSSRETAVKASLSDIYKKQGASPDQAAIVSNYVTGDYISKSQGGKVMNEIFPMTKWYATALKRLTLDSFTDPVSGKRFDFGTFDKPGRGLANSPWLTILPATMLTLAWNMAVTKGKRKDFDGLIIPGTHWKVTAPGYQKIVSDIMGTDDAMAASASHGSPVLRSIYERLSGRKVNGQPVNPFRREAGVSDAKEGAVAMKRGNYVGELVRRLGSGLPGTTDAFQNQADANKFSALLGMAQRAMDSDKNPTMLGKAASVARGLSPFQMVDLDAENARESYPNKEKALNDYTNAVGAAKTEARKAFMAAGGTQEELMEAVAAGKKQADELMNMSAERRKRWHEFNKR